MRSGITKLLSLFLLGTVVALLDSRLPVLAQDQPPPRPRPSTGSLDEILPDMRWNVEERGPLLIVAPDKIVRMPPRFRIENGRPIVEQPAQQPQGPDRERLVAWESYYDHHITSCGTLTVFAPTVMRVMNTRLPKPDLYADMRPADKWKLLQSSFSAAQWKQMCSEQGIGAGDLNNDQRQLFFSFLPNPLKIGTMGDENRQRGEPTVVENNARSQVRIALQRCIKILVEMAPNAQALITLGPEKRFYVENNDINHFPRPGEDAVEAYGAVLFEKVRARPKQGDLDFRWEGLNPSIFLTGAETVNDLITRIREATRLELYADRRYGELKVHVRGESARAGDVLRALCLGVSGAIRKVGPAYVLTEDREGFGSRQAILAQWAASAYQTRNQLLMESNNQLVKAPVETIPWASDDPMRPDTNLTNQINAFREKYQTQSPEERRKRENRELRLAITELPAAYQQSLQRQFASLERHPELAGNQVQLRKDSVVLEERAGFVVFVPGYGRVESQNLLASGSLPEGEYISWDRPRIKSAPPIEPFRYPDAVSLPEQPASRILVITVETTDEAKQAATEAKRLGFDTLWVEVKPDQKALLEAAVAAGKEQKVAIGAVVRALRSFRNTALPADQNLRGETSLKMAERFALNPFERTSDPGGGFVISSDGMQRTQARSNTTYDLAQERRIGDWLQSLPAESQAASVANILSLGRTPGIVGLVLRDLIPPGYRSPGGIHDYRHQYAEFEALGYSEEMRLAFLRQFSIDPIDLSPNGQGSMPFINKPFAQVSYPLFPDYGLTGKYGNGWGRNNGVYTYDMGPKDAHEKWLEYRVAVNQNLIRTVMKQVRAAVKIPLYWLNDHTDRRAMAGQWTALLAEGDAGITYLTPQPQPRQAWPPIESGDRPETPRTTPAQLARPGAKSIFATLSFVPRTEGDLVADFRQQAFSAFGRAQKGWDGIVVDLTALPLREAVRLLEQVPMRYEPPKPPQ